MNNKAGHLHHVSIEGAKGDHKERKVNSSGHVRSNVYLAGASVSLTRSKAWHVVRPVALSPLHSRGMKSGSMSVPTLHSREQLLAV